MSLIQQIEEAITSKDVTFSGFVIQACEYALENMETEIEKEEVNSSKEK